MRFSSITSSSFRDDLAQFGKSSCFKIKTCFGADISKLSVHPDEKEVLMPPYEKFEVMAVEGNKLGSGSYLITRSTMKTLNAAAMIRLFIILVLTVHMAPGVRSGNTGSKVPAQNNEVVMDDYPNSIDDEFEGCKEDMYEQVQTLLDEEKNSNANFRAAWNEAESHFPGKMSLRDVKKKKRKPYVNRGGTKR
ncbi:hypothetical protein SRHO_G00076900 [Serrasalmus rhombeus]